MSPLPRLGNEERKVGHGAIEVSQQLHASLVQAAVEFGGVVPTRKVG
jgi:hypothetical protein